MATPVSIDGIHDVHEEFLKFSNVPNMSDWLKVENAYKCASGSDLRHKSARFVHVDEERCMVSEVRCLLRC